MQLGGRPKRGPMHRRGHPVPDLISATRLRRSTAVLVALLVWLTSAPAIAQESAKEEMRGLDEQVQTVKSDVLRIGAELQNLEERLLYPSNTQVAVFVSLADGQTFRLDSVDVQIDGRPVAHYIYSFKELESLKKGGVQRIYIGNLETGSHQLDVAVAGKLQGGDDFSGSQSFRFDKEAEPKAVGITLAAGGSGGASIEIGGW